MTDPVTAASELTAALQDNTASLRKVLDRQRLLAVSVALLLGLFGLQGWFLLELRDTQHHACVANNDLRSGSLHIADALEQSLAAPRPDGRERTSAEIAATREFIADLRSDFALRDCG